MRNVDIDTTSVGLCCQWRQTFEAQKQTTISKLQCWRRSRQLQLVSAV